MGQGNQNIDWKTIILLLLLASFGLFLLLTTDNNLFFQQLIWLIATLVAYFVFSKMDSAILWWFAPFGYIISILFLISSYLGPHIRGATRWLILGPVRIQPSEVVKPLMLLFFTWLIVKYSPRQIKNIPIHMCLFLIPFLLVFKQPDLGSSLVYGAMWLGMMIAGGLALKYVISVIVGIIIIIPGLWHTLAAYQKSRIMTFLDPSIDPRGAGYNALQSTIAVGSGQFIGRGLGMGTQSHLRFLPEYHTDFIFATLVEELGFIGGFILLILYALLLQRILFSISKNSEHLPFFVFGFGLFMMILGQVFINVGMNMGILPITGITLPFVSYGGSSLLSFGISLGVMRALGTARDRLDSIAFS
jgi:rod shape determining protein RodA